MRARGSQTSCQFLKLTDKETETKRCPNMPKNLVAADWHHNHDLLDLNCRVLSTSVEQHRGPMHFCLPSI